MGHWFLLQEQEVSGPHSTDEVKKQVTDGRVPPSSLVWGPPQQEWRTVSWWIKALPQLLKESKPEPSRRLWHYAKKGSAYGPMNRAQLITALKEMKSTKGVMLWTKGMKAWAPIFEFHDLMDAVGVNRRQHPRAPIIGRVIVRKDEQTFIGQLKSISEGGFGCTEITSLETGEVVSVEMQSKEFYDPIQVKAQVRYITEQGFVGFKFKTINMESTSAIIQYVKSKALSTEEETKVAA